MSALPQVYANLNDRFGYHLALSCELHFYRGALEIVGKQERLRLQGAEGGNEAVRDHLQPGVIKGGNTVDTGSSWQNTRRLRGRIESGEGGAPERRILDVVGTMRITFPEVRVDPLIPPWELTTHRPTSARQSERGHSNSPR